MPLQENALNDWLKTQLHPDYFTLTPLSGDASFRRYFRLRTAEASYIVMDAPPHKEPLDAFINIGQQLRQHGIQTPRVLAVNQALGFALLQDFGDDLFLNALSAETANELYQSALRTLIQMQHCPAALPKFNEQCLLDELALFPNWFLDRHLGLVLSEHDRTTLDETFSVLIADILTQPTVFVHRDYHSRNIMVLSHPTSSSSQIQLGIIDYQDAVIGPFTYDLVSLLKDCYIQWPQDQLDVWLHEFYSNCPLARPYPFEAFKRAFELCGLQRHLKVLGIFCRLYWRDHKANYLNDLPLVFEYVMQFLQTSGTFAPFYAFMREKVQPVFLEKQ